MKSFDTPARRWVVVPAAFVLLVTLFALSACEELTYDPPAVGPDAQLTVVVDPALWQDTLATVIRQQLAPYIPTLPQAGRMFDIEVQPLSSNAVYERIKKMKNVLFIAPLNDTSNVADFLRERFSEAALQEIRQNGGVAIYKPNLWRTDQQVYYITAPTTEGLIETIQRRAPAIRDTLNLVLRRRLYEEMFDRGRQQDIERRLFEEHGFAVNVQVDFVPVNDTTVGNTGFVLLVRSLPQTWRRVFIWYKENADPSVISPEWIYAKQDSLAQIYLQGGVCGYAKISQRYIRERSLQTEPINFETRYGFESQRSFETRGLWYTAEETPEGAQMCFPAGGPFLTYTFYAPEQDRIYMIAGYVFAPDFEDREFVRQLEVIAHTFRTEAVLDAPEADTGAAAE